MLAIAALASCAKEEVIVADQGELIGFNSFVENSTRADKATDPSLNASNFKEFNVWGTVGGVAIYSGDKVTGDVGSNIVEGKETMIWTCPTVKQYWIKDAVYKFAALRNEGAKTNVTCVDNLPSEVKFDATAANVDLLYAKNYGANDNGIIGQASNNAPVNFNFEHLLSKVKFTVKNNSTSAVGYSFNVTNIDVKGAKTGTIVLADKSWKNKTAADVYEVADIAVASGVASQECANELLLIPGEFEITFDVEILCQGTKISTHESATVNKVTFAGGNSYNLVITVAVGEEITFSVTEEPEWTSNSDTTLTL